MLLLIWWSAWGRWARLSYALALAWLSASVLGLLWLPAALRVVFWWPMIAGVASAAVWYFVSAVRSRRPLLSADVNAVATGGLAIALAAGLPGYAAAPAPSTVWLLPGQPNAPEQFSVLVPPELLSQLKVLSHLGAAGLQTPLLLGGRYEGTVLRGTVDFWAELPVHCFADERALLTLPLAGVELQEVFLDGSVAYPTALAAPQNGYGIWLEGRGTHTLRVHFLVRVSGTGEDQEVRFSIPESAQTQLTLLAPEAAHYLRVVLGRGAQHVRAEPKGTRLEADLGRVSAVHVHWRQELPQPPPLTARVKECYYWDLQRAGNRLLGLLEYTVSRGALAELTVALPENLEVRQVELVSTGSGGLSLRLKDWTIIGASTERRLRLEFQVPVTNQVQVLLELVPRQPLTHHDLLLLPVAERTTSGEGWVAFRTNGLQGSITGSPGVEVIEPAIFERHWESAGTEYPGRPERAYHFLRASAHAPFWRLELSAPPPRRDSFQDVSWSVAPERAYLRVEARLKASAGDLALVEWEVPAEVIVADVRGPEVRSWSRTASRLQLWLQRSLAETTLELTGWVVRPGNQPAALFQLPCLALLGAVPQRTSVHVVAEKGWDLQIEKLNNLGELTDARATSHDLSFSSGESNYGGVFRLRPAVTSSDLQSLSWIEVRDRRMTFRATLDYKIGTHTPRKLTVRLRHWNGEPVHLDVPRTIRSNEGRRDSATRTWTLELPLDSPLRRPQSEANTRQQICQLSGTLTPDSNGEISMPEVSIDEATASEDWLAVVGPGLRPEEQQGLAVASDSSVALGRWPAVADSLRRWGGTVWKIDALNWKLRLRTDFPLVEPSPARVLLEEQAAAVLDGRHWLHQATYWLYQESGTHLGILLPNGATLRMASLDGSEITPLQAGSDRLWLPLSGGSGLRALCLRWVFGGDREAFGSPRLEKPYLENILDLPSEQRSPAVWTVHIPPGYRLDDAGIETIPGNQVEPLLNRATALFRATQLVAHHAATRSEEAETQLVRAAQMQFNDYCREAQYELAIPERYREKTPSLQDQASRLQQLLAENREFLRTHPLDGIRIQAESRRTLSASARGWQDGIGAARRLRANQDDLQVQQGTPTYWKLNDDRSSLPSVHLVAIEAEQRWQALGYSGLLLILLVLACILPAYPRVVSWLWASWPEQLILLGALIWLLRSESLAMVPIVFTGVLARLIYVGNWTAGRFRRSPSAVAGSGTSSAS
jgi:hypothetical protein